MYIHVHIHVHVCDNERYTCTCNTTNYVNDFLFLLGAPPLSPTSLLYRDVTSFPYVFKLLWLQVITRVQLEYFHLDLVKLLLGGRAFFVLVSNGVHCAIISGPNTASRASVRTRRPTSRSTNPLPYCSISSSIGRDVEYH